MQFRAKANDTTTQPFVRFARLAGCAINDGPEEREVAQQDGFGGRTEAAVPASSASPANGNREPEAASNYCPRCSARLAARSCKLICPSCGYYMSCSDFY